MVHQIDKPTNLFVVGYAVLCGVIHRDGVFFYENMQCQMEMLSHLKTQLLEILNDCTRSWLDMIKQWRYNISKREGFLLKKGASGFEENAAKDLMQT